jgi:hypothetical protein
VPILPRLASGSFSPEAIASITTAFEETLCVLGLVDRKDPAVTMVAKRMFELTKGREHDPILLRDAVLKSFGDHPPRPSGLYAPASPIVVRPTDGARSPPVTMVLSSTDRR